MGRRGRNKGRVLNGWLVIHKPVGVTSAHAVAMVKRITRAAKVGHGGTLDPFSAGLLPMALGEATKMLSLVLEGDKSYRCWIRFGAQTDTGDPTGSVSGQTDHLPDQPDLEAALSHFTGIQQQVPPVYSAIHVNGVRSYELARRGEAVELPARQVVIHNLHLESYSDGLAQVMVRCGKGTYMRSLARDLGRHLGSLAHLERLLRTETLGFSLEDGITLEELAAIVAKGRLREAILPVDRVLDDIPVLRLRSEDWHKIVNGQAVGVQPSQLIFHETSDHEMHEPHGSQPAGSSFEEMAGFGDRQGSSDGREYSWEMVRLMTPEGRFGGVGMLSAPSVVDKSRFCRMKRLFRL